MANKNTNEIKNESKHYSQPTISKVLDFLEIFMPITLAKRIVCIIALSIGVPVEEAARISDFCGKTVASIEKKMDLNEFDILFAIRGGGRTSPLSGFESEIIEEVEKNVYHTKQQIADMILEKYGIKITPQAVGKLLKKKASNY